jgi:hypothetical protein
MTITDYDTMLEKQHGVCAICKRPPVEGKYLYIDHDHTTGKVRGLLCPSCNHAVGILENDPSIVQKITEYLDPHL